MNPNPWAASDRHTDTEADRLTWLWGTLYDTIRDMLATLPTPIRIPHLTTGTENTAADTLTAIRDTDLYTQNLPADIIKMADQALTDAIHGVDGSNAERRHYITESQARTRAVVAFMGIGPEDMGVPDTLEELTL
ncbi:hypothetical protein Q8791_23685 [Nocardiopsis sp. CT-R113]|uniref:Uncharacterized protein n=1 Tax=Nocardiopsis codii TaxID=3065942 RepID=A0ABU7KDW3_9ACTN|nr:hypothetical protein [Nocardiopsis sp. CT-R113]MEE2040222.1 hypothetical protein [Nocardiopsis sp. CT-R113]